MLRSCLVSLVVGLPVAVAAADPDPAAEPAPVPRPGLTLPAGALNLAVTVEIEMSVGRVAKPLSIAPDVSYGVSDDLTVALVHSSYALSGFRAKAGGGLCLTGDDGGCVAVYNNVGAEGWYRLAAGKLAAAVGGGVHATNLDAGFYGIKLGAKVRQGFGKLAVTTLPSVLIAITKREDDAGTKLNKDMLWVPVQLTYRVADPLTVGLGTGIKGPLSGFGDAWQVPLGFMAQYAIDRQLGVGASWVFGQIVGGAENPPDPLPAVVGPDLRGVQIWASYTR